MNGNLVTLILSVLAVIAAFLGGFVSIARSRRRGGDIALFISMLLVAIIEAADLGAVTVPESLAFWRRLGMAAESLSPVAWLTYALLYAREGGFRSVGIFTRMLFLASFFLLPFAVSLGTSSLFYSPDFSTERVLFLGTPGFVFYCFLMLFLTVPLIQLEATLRTASRSERYRIKFEIFGSGAIILAFVFYYGQGLLYRTIDVNFLPARSLVMIVAVGLITYSRLRRGDGARLVVSPQMAFRSAILFVIGGYLIILGAVGEAMRYLERGVAQALIYGCAALGAIALCILFASEQVRRKLRVFLHKNFYAQKYDYRVQWLEFTARLAAARTRDDVLAAIVSGFCETFGMGGGALFLPGVVPNLLVPVASHALWLENISFRQDQPLVQFMESHQWVLNVAENQAALGVEDRDILQEHGIVIVVPLFVAERVEGVLFLARPLVNSESYIYEDYDLMKTLARQAAASVQNLRLSEQLAQSREMEAMGKVSTFIVHDLKNLVYTLSLIVDNAKQYIAEPEFQQDMLDSLGNTVSRMKILISRLRNLTEKIELHRTTTDLLNLVRKTTDMVSGVDIVVSGEPVEAQVDVDELHKVALNLLVNAVDATDGKGPVHVAVGCAGQAFIRVRDEGCGIEEEFLRNHLFTPFRTTKKKGMGIGLYQCKQIVEAHGGSIEVSSQVGKGTEFTVWLPIIAPA